MFEHVMSRIVGRAFLMNPTEKERLLQIIKNQEAFSGVTVINYAILDNHFHLMLEQPDPEKVPKLTVNELFKRLPAIYTEPQIKNLRKQFDDAELEGYQHLVGVSPASRVKPLVFQERS